MRLRDRIMKTPAKDWYYSALPANQTPNDIPTTVLSANTSYLNVYLKSVSIVNIRHGFRTFYLHSFISLDTRNSKAEFNVVATPNELAEVAFGNLDRIPTFSTGISKERWQLTNLNKRLLGSIPYRGGDVQIDLGFFSVQLSDQSTSFLSRVADMSNLAGVSFIGKVMPFMNPISKGVALLDSNNTTTELEVGMATYNYEVTTGYYVSIAADKSKIQTGNLYIDPEDYKLCDDNCKPIQDHSYMVFSISSTDKKYDWFDIPELASTYETLRDDVRKGDTNAAAESLRFFKRTVLTSNDLLPNDAKEIATTVEKEINDILKTKLVATRARQNE
jgi:hypothetical protein